MKSYHDIVGDGGSRILEQVEARRERLRRRLAGVRRTLAVGSGKGGVGKSTLTMKLASTLAAAEKKVAILDADLNGPSQARLAGMREVPFVPQADGIALPKSRDGIGVVSLGSVIPESSALEFDSVAPGEAQTWRATREFTALGDLLTAIDWGELDLLLVDLPPGAERTVQYAEFLGEQTVFVLVTVPSELSRGVVSRSVAALAETASTVVGYIENMKGYWCADCGRVKPLFPETGSVPLDLPCLGSVPFDPELAARCDRGEPAATDRDGPAARALREVACNLLQELEKPK